MHIQPTAVNCFFSERSAHGPQVRHILKIPVFRFMLYLLDLSFFYANFPSADIFLEVPPYRDSFAPFVSPYFERERLLPPSFPVKNRFIPAFPAHFRPVSLPASVYDYFESREQLAAAGAEWERLRNENQAGIDWQFTTEKARIKLKRLYPTLSVK